MGEHGDLKDYIAETKRRPQGQIDPLPTFRPYQSFSYSAAAMRSPFEQPVEDGAPTFVGNPSNVKPDFSREKEFLENFNFASLSMVGTLEQAGTLWALINDGEGAIHRVTQGNFMGKNHGKIIEATRTRLEIVEIVPDGLDGWVERPRVLKLVEKE
ncbi:pilus assembly protein PilP [Exilibacterium tricleocarpae]|uniref:Pilus assembly protein PilP n=2 Tax=Exilibacterium tricleocarpae TaxID=2591008 RepID=A0A545T6E4_9GAMM|nr:pilus assembly protein PilP [Exilibacterium tricleocarpae]TQV72742.1 pilus assembly protein PilP [Exilibacterium tricleocarpae]